jgi:hypothetical protein
MPAPTWTDHGAPAGATVTGVVGTLYSGPLFAGENNYYVVDDAGRLWQ